MSSRSKQRPPRLAAYRVDRDTLVIKVLNGQDPGRQGQEERPQQHKEPRDGSAVDLRAVVQSRSLQLSGVSCRPLALPDAAPEEGGPFPVPGLRRLARIVSETFLVARLAVRLFTYVGFGYRWISSFLALMAYAMLLMPGFLQVSGRSGRVGIQERKWPLQWVALCTIPLQLRWVTLQVAVGYMPECLLRPTEPVEALPLLAPMLAARPHAALEPRPSAIVLQMVAFYFLSPRVLRSIRYGPESRNVLDLYLPPGHLEEMGEREGRPVVVYVTGG